MNLYAWSIGIPIFPMSTANLSKHSIVDYDLCFFLAVPLCFQSFLCHNNCPIARGSLFLKVCFGECKKTSTITSFNLRECHHHHLSNSEMAGYRCGDLVDLCRGPHLPNTNRAKVWTPKVTTSRGGKTTGDRILFFCTCLDQIGGKEC